MAYAHLLLEQRGRIAWISLNRPKANALSLELVRELDDALSAAERDPDIRCVTIASALERFFSGGADVTALREMLGRSVEDNPLLMAGIQLMDRIEAFPKPVVASVNGLALGGGCELTLACHIRLAADTAEFALPEVALGIIPGWGGTYRLPRRVGPSRALEWMLTGRRVTAAEAREAGLVAQVVPEAELPEATRQLAETLGERPPVAVRAILRAVREGGLDPARGAVLELEGMQEAARSKDAAEGLAAFLEKRTARFVGE